MSGAAESSQRRVKFAELATKRVNKATQAIRVIGNLSNRSNYEYTEQDVQRIIKELNTAVVNTKRRFSSGTGADTESFRILP
jgi:cell fate (sporulation/competence/biofilm development) regulator YlbF (YheA/YmcA/DUF963 family)